MAGVAMVDLFPWRKVEGGTPCGGCGKASREGAVGEEADEGQAVACRTESRRRRRAIIRQEGEECTEDQRHKYRAVDVYVCGGD